jgi:hypothetical protein
MSIRGPQIYRSFEEFEREEIAPHKKCGWSLDDLYEDAKFRGGVQDEFESGPRELDFDDF